VRRKQLNLEHLHTFAEVVRQGSFSGAGNKLGMTQPAVSLQMLKLEQWLGLRLIERIGKRAFATAAGSDLLPFARRLQDESDAAVRHMQRHAQAKLGRLRMGTGETACLYLFPSVLASLHKTQPDLEITVVTGNTSEMLDLVESNALDIALVTLPVHRRTLALRFVLNDPLVAVLPLSDRSSSDSLRPQYFSNKPLILYEPGGAIRTVIDPWLAASGTPPKPIMEVGSIEATKRLVAVGLGCSIVPSMALNDQSAHRLRIRSLVPKLSRRLGLVLRHDKVLDPALRGTIKAFERIIEPHAAGRHKTIS